MEKWLSAYKSCNLSGIMRFPCNSTAFLLQMKYVTDLLAYWCRRIDGKTTWRWWNGWVSSWRRRAGNSPSSVRTFDVCSATTSCNECARKNRSVSIKLFTSYQLETRDVTEPANIRIRRMRISCAKSVGFGCGCGFVARSNTSLL